MSDGYYRLPTGLARDIDVYEREVRDFLEGEMAPELMRAKRVPRGVYEQRQNGVYMVRVRIAGGTFTLRQGRELAALAGDYGNGMLHPTTRQDIQLHEIALADTPAIMRRLMRVGLTSKGGGGNTVRNVAACPYAGICPRECFDVTGAAHAVTEHLIGLEGSYNLPRKYKIAFSGCPADCALGQVADLGFLARVKDGQPGFRVYAGGGMGANSRLADVLTKWMPAAEVVRASEAVRRLFDKLGDRGNKNRARLRYVFERIGPEEFKARFDEELASLGADDAPAWQGGLQLNRESQEGSGPPAIKKFEGALGYIAQRQKDLCTVPLHLPLGFVSSDSFGRICALAQRFSQEGGLRTNRFQNLMIRFVDKQDLGALRDELLLLNSHLVEPGALKQFVACAGAATCRLGLCLAREASRAAAECLDASGLAEETVADLDIHINGCPNACGQQPVGPIGFYGVAQRVEGHLMPCYRVSLGGRCNAEGARLGTVAGQIPAKTMPRLLADLGSDFEAGRQGSESFNAYYDRRGTPHFEEIVARHTATPRYAEGSDFYRDFGCEQDFSLAGRGSGECGAGVFALIQRDLAEARKAQEPFAILLPAARALLITRGVDARDGDTVCREFEKHFIDKGLVSEDFRDLLSRARGYRQGWKDAFAGYEGMIARLLDRVELLYSSLDASLEFHPPEEAGAEGVASAEEDSREVPESEGVMQIDLAGVACPLNFVKAKLQIEGLQLGKRLAIILDDGEPIENVPASFRSEGQTIEEMVDLGDGRWRVVVKKEK